MSAASTGLAGSSTASPLSVGGRQSAGQARFDAQAGAWDDKPIVRQAAAHMLAVLSRPPFSLIPSSASASTSASSSPPSSRTALEVGCGTGLVTLAVAPHVRSLVAIDTSAGMLQVVARKQQQRLAAAFNGGRQCDRNIHPVQLELTRASQLPGMRFDVIYSVLTAHHIPLPDMAALLAALLQLLKPGGSVVFLDIEYTRHSPLFHPTDRPDVMTHGSTAGQWRRWFTAAGYVDVACRRSCTLSHVVGAGHAHAGTARDFPFLLASARRPLPSGM
jgi:SAM-dependent methyltransferase